MVPLEDLVLEQVVPADLVVVVLLAELLDPQLHLDKEMLVELVVLEVLIEEVEAAVPVVLVLMDLVARVVLVLKYQPHSEIQIPHQVLEVDH
tara:strand:+ start:332 stop:607 length:276 start_codon:yes stop_codon:yes gene_type:complete